MKNVKIKSPDTPLASICTVTDSVQAVLIKNMLADHSIKAQLIGEHQGGFTGTFDIEVIVREADSAKALEFIEAHFPKV